MCGDGVDDLRRLAVLARDLRTHLRVRALHLVLHGLADVMQQAGAARLLDRDLQLRGDHPAM